MLHNVPSPFHLLQDIVLPDFFPSPYTEEKLLFLSLDLTRALNIYLERTTPFGNVDFLFVLLEL